MSVLIVLLLLATEIVSESDFEDKQFPNWDAIFPGTKWCGSGKIATHYDDLGKEVETDKCCRTHDYCNDTINEGKTKYNLVNSAFHTRLNCRCDEEFRACLRKADTLASNKVGFIFFDFLETKCFREDYPVIRCITQITIPKPRCLKYEYDTSKPKQYQWFDLPVY